LNVLVTGDAPATVASLTGVAILMPRRSHRSTRLSLGSTSGRVAAGRATTLTLRPSSGVLAKLRAGAAKHGRIALTIKLTAVNVAAWSVTNASVPKLTIK
jgi:hypothetical protein